MSHFKGHDAYTSDDAWNRHIAQNGRELFAQYADDQDRRFEYLERKLDGIYILLSKMYQIQALQSGGELAMDALGVYPRGTFAKEIDRLLSEEH